MNCKSADPQLDQAPIPSDNTSELNFNFDLWAKAVKQQMIASLRKRGEH